MATRSPATFPAFREYARPALAIALAYLAFSVLVNLRYHHVLWGVEWDKYAWFLAKWPDWFLAGAPEERSLRWDMNRPPLYYFVGTAARLLVGDPFRGGQFVSQLSGTAMVLLAATLGAALSGKRSGALLAAAMTAVDEGILLFGMSCATDMLFAVLSVAAIAVLFARWHDLRAGDALAMGVLLGLSYTTRYQALIFWAGAAAAIALRAPRPRSAALLAPFILGTAIGLVPAVVASAIWLDLTPVKTLGGIGIRHPHFTRLVGAEAGVLDHAAMLWKRLHYRHAFVHLLYMTSGIPLLLAIAGSRYLRARRSPLRLPWGVLVATGVLYFFATGWNSLESYVVDDSRRFYLPLLPPLFAAAATGALALRAKAARVAVAIGTVLLLAGTTVALHLPLILAPPSDEERFARRLAQVVDVGNARIIGYPVALMRVFPRFGYLGENCYFNGWGNFRADASLPAAVHDLVVLPAWIIEGSRKAAGTGPWFLSGYDRLLCAEELCALRARSPAPN
jgi:4-amino-4-deoxy-L-arabinose transferase-like glycosyltransferase